MEWLPLLLCIGTATSLSDQVVKEDLFIMDLPDARTLAHFQFSVTWPLLLAQDFKGKFNIQ